jgi:hypothetical protein
MDHGEIAALMKRIAPVVRDYVTTQTEPLIARIAELESRPAVPGPPGKDGASVTLDDVRPIIDEAVSSAAAAIVAEPGAAGPPGPPGKDIDPDEVAARIDHAVKTAVGAIPAPKDGQSVTLDDVRPLIDEAAQKAVSALPVPKDGVGMAGALIDRDGGLVVTLSDGTTRELGPVVGKDGAPGNPGSDGQDGKDGIGRDGRDGKDGRDGFGFEDLDVVHDGARGFIFRFARGSEVKEFPFTVPVLIYRGVFREGDEYQTGDTVTWAGSLWHCDEDTKGKPGDGQKAWTLAAKRGRDGKDGVIKEAPKVDSVRVGPGPS